MHMTYPGSPATTTVSRRRAVVVALAMITVVVGVVGAQGTAEADGPPDIWCRAGFVWRQAVSWDQVCVVPQTRDQTWNDNALDGQRKLSNGWCVSGFVWREAVVGDHVCVAPWTRAQAAYDNGADALRRCQDNLIFAGTENVVPTAGSPSDPVGGNGGAQPPNFVRLRPGDVYRVRTNVDSKILTNTLRDDAIQAWLPFAYGYEGYRTSGAGWGSLAPAGGNWPIPGVPKYGLIAQWQNDPNLWSQGQWKAGFTWLGETSGCVQWTGATTAIALFTINDDNTGDNRGTWGIAVDHFNTTHYDAWNDY